MRENEIILLEGQLWDYYQKPGPNPEHSLWQVLIAVSLTLQECSQTLPALGQHFMLDKVVTLFAKSVFPPLDLPPVKEHGELENVNSRCYRVSENGCLI